MKVVTDALSHTRKHSGSLLLRRQLSTHDRHHQAHSILQRLRADAFPYKSRMIEIWEKIRFTRLLRQRRMHHLPSLFQAAAQYLSSVRKI